MPYRAYNDEQIVGRVSEAPHGFFYGEIKEKNSREKVEIPNKCGHLAFRIAENNIPRSPRVLSLHRPTLGKDNKESPMSTLKPVLIALSLMLVAPMAVQASEITLVPAVKLQIGDRDNNGHYWDGGRWRDHDWWKAHYDWRDNHWRPHDEHRKHDDRHDDHHHDDRRDDRGPDWKHH